VLLQLAVWCVGEYGEMLVGGVPAGVETEAPEPVSVVERLVSIMRSPVSDLTTKEYTLNAFVKLTTRFANHQRAISLIHEQLNAFSGSMSLELQQRSVEYISLLRLDSIRAGVLERMPAFAKKDRQAAAAAALGGGGSRDSAVSAGAPAPPAAPPAAPAPVSDMDLLGDLLGGSAPAPPAATGFGGGAPAPTPPPAAGGAMDLLDLLGGGPPASAHSAPPIDAMAMMGLSGAPPPTTPAGGFAPFQAYSKNGLSIMFACSKDPSNPSITTIEASFTSSMPQPLEGLNFQVAVPKYMKLQMTPASSSTVPPNGMGKVTQLFKVANSMHGQKPVVLKIKVDYTSGGMPVSEMGQVDNFPPGV